MAHQLDAVRLKLERAKERLRAFDSESGEWLEQTELCIFVPEDHAVERVFFARITATPPARFSTILGDCLQNLRASLDYLAWALVLVNHHTPNDGTYFPIYRNGHRPGKHFRPKCLTGVDPKAIAIIERLQPNYGGQNPDLHLLWFLRELSNHDKHREINVVVGRLVVNTFRFYMRFGEDVRIMPAVSVDASILNDGAKVASYRLAALAGGEPLRVEAENIGFLTLGDALPWGATAVSRQIEGIWWAITEDILPLFEQFFPS